MTAYEGRFGVDGRTGLVLAGSAAFTAACVWLAGRQRRDLGGQGARPAAVRRRRRVLPVHGGLAFRADPTG